MLPMTYAEESEIAQRVLDYLASRASMPIPGGIPPKGTRGARVYLRGADYTVHRHGNDLRFSTPGSYGSAGEYLIVQIGGHQGGWVIARSVRPPGEYHDPRAAEEARQIVEHALARLGYPVGTPGREGRPLDRAKIEREIQSIARPAGARGTRGGGRSHRPRDPR